MVPTVPTNISFLSLQEPIVVNPARRFLRLRRTRNREERRHLSGTVHVDRHEAGAAILLAPLTLGPDLSEDLVSLVESLGSRVVGRGRETGACYPLQ